MLWSVLSYVDHRKNAMQVFMTMKEGIKYPKQQTIKDQQDGERANKQSM